MARDSPIRHCGVCYPGILTSLPRSTAIPYMRHAVPRKTCCTLTHLEAGSDVKCVFPSLASVSSIQHCTVCYYIILISLPRVTAVLQAVQCSVKVELSHLESGSDVKVLLHVCAQHLVSTHASQLSAVFHCQTLRLQCMPATVISNDRDPEGHHLLDAYDILLQYLASNS